MQQLPVISSINTPKPPTLRDWAAVGFRRRRLIAFSFLLIFAAATLITIFMPREYEAETKIMVKRDRSEPLVTLDDRSASLPEVTEQDLNSEVELLKSRDLLRRVAIETGVPATDDLAIHRAILDLEKNMTVERLKKTKMIRVAYRSWSPPKAESVLQTISRLYLDKHLEVHRPPGVLDFFQTQTDQYRKQLQEAEAAMTQFGDDEGVVEAPLSKEIAVRNLNEFEAGLKETRAAIAATEQRIRSLEQQQASTDPRMITSVRTSANPVLLQELKSKLLSLELKRTELLNKFSPEYRLVKEVDAQIAQTREALENAENNPVREETTDRDATHELIRTELAKARAELKSLQARAAATTNIVGSYREQARKLNQTEIAQQDLLRKTKTAEENYLLYSRKQEEALISDALDRRRIVNVSIAQPPAASPTPAGTPWPLNLALGFLLASFFSVGLGVAADRMDRSFRTPDEVEVFLNVPVIAALPAPTESGDKI